MPKGPYPLTVNTHSSPTHKDGCIEVVTAQGNHYATTYDPQAANLIAAAPDMLEALSRLIKAINVPTPDPLIVMATIEQAKAAITKAEGK